MDERDTTQVTLTGCGNGRLQMEAGSGHRGNQCEGELPQPGGDLGWAPGGGHPEPRPER